MIQWLRILLTEKDRHQPCDKHRDEAADLRSQLHQAYDQRKLQGYTIAQLQADNRRLLQDNHNLRRTQQEHIIGELADRIIEQKLVRETPELVLPCPQHRSAGMTFATA